MMQVTETLRRLLNNACCWDSSLLVGSCSLCRVSNRSVERCSTGVPPQGFRCATNFCKLYICIASFVIRVLDIYGYALHTYIHRFTSTGAGAYLRPYIVL
jgi:hypothetical protein